MIKSSNEILSQLIGIICLTFVHFSPAQSDSLQFKDADVFPNPFQSQLTINHNKNPENIEEIVIYDALGNVVYVFQSSDWMASNTLTWDGTSTTGQQLPNGMYFVQLLVREESESILVQKIQ